MLLFHLPSACIPIGAASNQGHSDKYSIIISSKCFFWFTLVFIFVYFIILFESCTDNFGVFTSLDSFSTLENWNQSKAKQPITSRVENEVKIHNNFSNIIDSNCSSKVYTKHMHSAHHKNHLIYRWSFTKLKLHL